MIDPQLLRENPDVVRRSQEARGVPVSTVDDAIAADTARRAALATFENARAEQNVFGKTVAAAPKDEKAALVAQAQQMAAAVKTAQAAVTDAEAEFEKIVGAIQNIVIDGIPAGGEENFVTKVPRGFAGSEDFAWMLDALPGCYLLLGNGEGEFGGCMVHNPGYDFNDQVLPLGAACWVRLAQTYLAKT